MPWKLGVIYSMGTSVPQFSWTVIGVGLRAATEIGLHRQKPKGHKLTVNDELKKRSFWYLYHPSFFQGDAESLCVGRLSCLTDY